MKLIKKGNFLLILLLVILIPVSISYGKAPVEDPSPVNLTGQEAIYDHRDTGVVSNSGAYFLVDVGVVPGGFLSDHNDVLEVKVKHLETEQEYTLLPDACTNFLDLNAQSWAVFLRPSSWMFQGTWRFTMLYKGNDGHKHKQFVHKQFVDAVPGPEVFPTVPSDIQIVKTGGFITISWSAIPIQSGYLNAYRIRIYPDGICPKNWTILYNPYEMTVSSYPPIPESYVGSKIRLENRMVIPTPPPTYFYSRGTKEFILE